MHRSAVLAFTDFSAAAENALDRAADVAARLNATLHLAYSGKASGPRLAEHLTRLTMRSRQLEGRLPIAVRHLSVNALNLDPVLATHAQIVVVADPVTANTLRLRQDWRWWNTLLDLGDVPLLLVQRDASQAYDSVLVAYDTPVDARRLSGLAVGMSDARDVDLFCVSKTHDGQSGPSPDGLRQDDREWPPPGALGEPARRVRLSDHLTSRRNRALFHQGSTDRVLPVSNQADFGEADLVVATYPSATLIERLMGRTFQRRLARRLTCDLLLCPEALMSATAAHALRRLLPAAPPSVPSGGSHLEPSA